MAVLRGVSGRVHTFLTPHWPTRRLTGAMIYPAPEVGEVDRHSFEILRRIPMFASLEGPWLLQLARRMRKVSYPAKSEIVRQGDPGGDLYLVKQGHLKVMSQSREGRDVVLAVMGPGEVFGEVTLLDGAPRSATVTALEPVDLLLLERRDCLDFLRANPEISVRIIQVLAQRVRHLSQRSEDVALLDVSCRLARAVLQLRQRFSSSEEPGLLTVKLSQQELGDLIGATRESVNKRLRSWEQAGVIRQVGGYLHLVDEQALQTMAGRGGDA